jgi:sulfur relay (sulfurtransferase) complex TusBCD TusD component (DsrE family)
VTTNPAKDEFKSIIDKLPDDCTFEDAQYHLCVNAKIHRGISRAESESVLSQGEVEKKFAKWISK